MARIKSDNERLDETHFEKVILGMESVPKMTKKDACAILGIAYNTTRLDSLIEKYLDKKKRDSDRRSSLRGKPASKEEITYTVQEYLEGATIDAISKSTFRGPTFIKSILEKYDVPIRNTSTDYFRPELIPDGATRERFTVSEVVYSARYDSIARIDTEKYDARYGWIYRIWLMNDKWLQSAYQPAEELASLEHLRVIGVKI